MLSFILSFGSFCLLYLATLHFTGCWFWHHTLPGIALNFAWLKMNVTVLQQETSFCGFGDRSGWSFKCAHKDNYNNSHSYLTINFFSILVFILAFLILSLQKLMICYLFLFIISTWNHYLHLFSRVQFFWTRSFFQETEPKTLFRQSYSSECV